MAEKAKIPAPIDRPLSRAYLREFTGWSTAYPPGLSDPTSLRVMENIQINRDGSCRVRPGLRYLSYTTPPTEDPPALGIGVDEQLVGTHEVFFLNDGTKAYLFAVREADLTVGFRVLRLAGEGSTVHGLTDVGIDFEVPQGEELLNFSEATTYVKYVQIDNKILALSNAGETMRLFYVGEEKIARRLSSIERPDWSVADKLTVVHPDAAWVNTGAPTGVRTNLVPNPSWVTDEAHWFLGAGTDMERSSDFAQSYAHSLKLASEAERTNFMTRPLHDLVTYGIAGWTAYQNSCEAVNAFGGLTARCFPTLSNFIFTVQGPTFSIPSTGHSTFKLAVDLVDTLRIDQFGAIVKWYGSNGAQVGADQYYGTGTGAQVNGRKVWTLSPRPAGAVSMRVLFVARSSNSGNGTQSNFVVNDIVVAKSTEDTAMFHGSSGVNYSWTGAAGASSSVYHPPKQIYVRTAAGILGMVLPESEGTYTGSIYVRAGVTTRDWWIRINWYGADGGLISSSTSAATAAPAGAWTRLTITDAAPAGAARASLALQSVDLIPRGEVHYADSAMFELGAAATAYFDGGFSDTATLKYDWSGTAHGSSSTETTYATGLTIPAAETKTVDTLISSAAADNVFNYGFFYTFSNEIGESAASQITVVKAQRGWPSWTWETPNAAGEPSGTAANDPGACADQLVAYMPEAVYDAALAQGATHWNLYMLTWSLDDAVPVMAVQVDRRELDPDTPYGAGGWARTTPQMNGVNGDAVPLPNPASRFNYSNPSRAGQGLVAADRLVLVLDPVAQAVVRWTSNEQGEYLNFTAHKAGGYKTLTSGNLYVPAAVKLWQNPQSADTITILCLGVDGQSTAYYMQPAQIAQQSEAVNIMGFEETTATPGTVSPYGVEVLNNALYHPLDTELMKSTASNYNINHKSMTDLIQFNWEKLSDKLKIVSSQHDNRLYYIVQNPDGEPLEEGCNGNEVWVYDTGVESGSWSRWLIQAHSLRKIEHGGRNYMSVVRPDGVFYLDPEYGLDDVVDPDTREVGTAAISWRLETNTQGANRAHDAWAHLQQANVTFGNFVGQCRYGVRAHDIHGKAVNISKVFHSSVEAEAPEPYDQTDHLLIRRDLMEWFFYAESVTDEEGAVEESYGDIGLVQYKYTPVTVNVGYESGSVETFEYGRSLVPASEQLTVNGVPKPHVNTSYP